MNMKTWIALVIIALAAMILAFWRFSGGRFG